MSWVKLDDSAPDAPAFMELPRSTRLLHLEALAWSNRHAAGGKIPAGALQRLTDAPEPTAAAAELVEAGLWAMSASGWQLVWLLSDQPTPEEMQKRQERNRAKQARHRKHVSGDHSDCKDSRYCKFANPVTNRGSNHTPSRPDPTISYGDKGGEEGIATDRLVEPPAAPREADPIAQRRKLARVIRTAREEGRHIDVGRFTRAFTRSYGHLYERGAS